MDVPLPGMIDSPGPNPAVWSLSVCHQLRPCSFSSLLLFYAIISDSSDKYIIFVRHAHALSRFEPQLKSLQRGRIKIILFCWLCQPPTHPPPVANNFLKNLIAYHGGLISGARGVPGVLGGGLKVSILKFLPKMLRTARKRDKAG